MGVKKMSPSVASKQAVRTIYTNSGLQFNDKALSLIGRSSNGVFAFKSRIEDANRISSHAQRSYSIKSNKKSSKKHHGKDGNDHSKKKPELPVPGLGKDLISRPTLFQIVKDLFKYVSIRFNVDPKFRWKDFSYGASQALEVVSHKLAAGDFENLKELVDSEELKRVQAIIEPMTLAQRNELAINKNDILQTFGTDVVITENGGGDSDGDTKRTFVEVTVIFNTLKGLQQLNSQSPPEPFMKMRGSITSTYIEFHSGQVANYRFRKEFTEGFESDWIITQIKQEKSTVGIKTLTISL